MFKKLSYALTAACMALTQPAAVSAQGGGDAYLGQLMLVGFNFCPRGWSTAEGQLLAINSNQALFSLLGTTYGGDGRTTFGLPDLRGRAPIGIGHGPGLSSYSWGQRVGVEYVILNSNQMPSHSHLATSTAQLHGTDGTVNSPSLSGASLADQPAAHYSTRALDQTMKDGSVTVTTTVLNNGGNLSHETRAPRLAMYWCIALQGIFPSRS